MEDREQLLTGRTGERRLNCRWSVHVHSLQSKVVEDFRRRLKYFFMNPCEKYRARGRKPWKLTLQILKIAIITIQVLHKVSVCIDRHKITNIFLLSPLLQLVSFGLSNEMMVTFKEENLMTFRNLFLKGYKDQKMGGYALYTKADTYDHIYYIINKVGTSYPINILKYV